MLSETVCSNQSGKSRIEGKKLLLILIIHSTFLIVNCIAQQYGWKNISSNLPDLPNDTLIIGSDTMVAMIRAAHFLDDSEGWIVMTTTIDSSYILHTENGGDSWEHRSTHKTAFNDIHMRDQNTGFTGGQDGGIIYKTVDGGYTWNFHWTLGTTLAEIEFPPLPADTGFACGMNGTLMMITPTGGTIMDVNVNSDLHGLSFPVNSNQGWLTGWNIVRHYLNGVWYADQVHITGYHTAVDFVDNQTGWTCGDRIMHTTDGYNWFDQVDENQLEGDLFSISFANTETGCAVGTVGQVFFTTDGGNNWNEVDLGTKEYLIDVQMTSPTCGYISGHKKLIYKYTQISDVQEEQIQLTEFKLEQNFPNPFNPSTRIQFQVSNFSQVVLKVYDVLGNEVATLVDEYKPAGSYEVKFNTSSINHQTSSGIYFYQIKADEYLETKKMILIK